MSFKIRTTKPEKGNKFYNNSSNGGVSWCITGYPKDSGCNVLANCVGYACGRFNEIIGEMKYPTLCCNAENFIERAKAAGLEVGWEPRPGGIMVWKKGKTLNGNDGAGHVAVPEKVYNSNRVLTSESGYGGSAFWNAERTNNNGRWGMGEGYTYLGCIYNPAVKAEEKKDDKDLLLVYKVGDKVKINGVYRRSDSTEKLNPLRTTGTITAILTGKRNPYLLDDGNLGWVNNDCIVSKVDDVIRVGDKVKVTNPYDEKGRRLYVSGTYDVIEVSGNRIVIGKGKAVTAAINKDNLVKI